MATDNQAKVLGHLQYGSFFFPSNQSYRFWNHSCLQN